MREEEVVKRLREAGHKLMPQRLKIIKTLVEQGDKHSSLKSVLVQVKNDLGTTSFSTLYATFLKLEELGFIKLFDLKGETRIETNVEPHVNIVDMKSGTVTDLTDENLLKQIIEILKARKINVGDNILVNILVY